MTELIRQLRELAETIRINNFLPTVRAKMAELADNMGDVLTNVDNRVRNVEESNAEIVAEESNRIFNESKRIHAENERKSNENTRETNETERVVLFDSMMGEFETIKDGLDTNKFKTIENMQTGGQHLAIGTVVEVLGYYEAGDGAGHKRIITSMDDGSGVPVGSKWANLVGERLDVRWFGVDDDDCSTAFNKAFEYVTENHKKLYSSGTFNVKNTINFIRSFDFSDCEFIASGVGACFKGVSHRNTQKFGSILYKDNNCATSNNWAKETYAIEYLEGESTTIEFNVLDGAKKGLLINPQAGKYFAYNKINGNGIYNCGRGVAIEPRGDLTPDNFANQNVFNINKIAHFSNALGNYGCKIYISKDANQSPNENIFNDVCLEGGGPNQKTIYSKNGFNKYINCRYEHCSPIILEGSANYTAFNRFIGGYGLSLDKISKVGTILDPVVETDIGVRTGMGPLRLRNVYSVSDPLIETLRTYGDSKGVVITSTDIKLYDSLKPPAEQTEKIVFTGNIGGYPAIRFVDQDALLQMYGLTARLVNFDLYNSRLNTGYAGSQLPNPRIGQMFFNRTTNKINVFNGTKWVNADGTDV